MYRNSLVSILFVILKLIKISAGFLDIEELRELKYGIEITKKPVLLSVRKKAKSSFSHVYNLSNDVVIYMFLRA